eukprot:CAMPEP_0184318262 /NCGR_PEP_ID=MMETSP1049-20130417/101617_1 /TAXON_ID=77928 /ORGANISM="Proteomonas sulcata, Strain CCMP704" /LENGTH=126 /DNA_ID=CAMNT_0026637971 /DNA_START=145 /DNA_END=521 /DNA_ORIENTATION=-
MDLDTTWIVGDEKRDKIHVSWSCQFDFRHEKPTSEHGLDRWGQSQAVLRLKSWLLASLAIRLDRVHKLDSSDTDQTPQDRRWKSTTPVPQTVTSPTAPLPHRLATSAHLDVRMSQNTGEVLVVLAA